MTGRIATILGCGFLASLWLIGLVMFAAAQEGRHGVGHERWHQQFYQSLKRPDAPGISCCSMQDCSPTTSRQQDGRYQVMCNGAWRDVPMHLVVRRSAPDGGAHVCASAMCITIYCVVLPPES